MVTTVQAKKRKPKTNVQFLKQLIENDPLAQALVIEAIGRYADAVAESKPEEYEKTLVSGPAWIATGKRIQQALKEQYESF